MSPKAYLQSLDATRRRSRRRASRSTPNHWRTWCNVHIYMWRHGLLARGPRRRTRGPLRSAKLRRAVLSARRFDDVATSCGATEFLAEITNSPDEYGEWGYFLTIFGTPSDGRAVGLAARRHRINLHCFVLGEVRSLLTPAFPGAEPATSSRGSTAGLCFEAEEGNGSRWCDHCCPMPRRRGDPVPRRSFTATSPPGSRRADTDVDAVQAAFRTIELAYEGLAPARDVRRPAASLRDLVRDRTGASGRRALHAHDERCRRPLRRRTSRGWAAPTT